MLASPSLGNDLIDQAAARSEMAEHAACALDRRSPSLGLEFGLRVLRFIAVTHATTVARVTRARRSPRGILDLAPCALSGTPVTMIDLVRAA